MMNILAKIKSRIIDPPVIKPTFLLVIFYTGWTETFFFLKPSLRKAKTSKNADSLLQ